MDCEDSHYVRIGCGSSCESDRIEEAVRLANSGLLDYIVFDRLSEWVTAYQHLDSYRTNRPIFDPEFGEYLGALVPAVASKGVRVITNAGGNEPEAALEVAEQTVAALGIPVSLSAPRTVDYLDIVLEVDPVVLETGERVSQLPREPIGASVYFGARQVAASLDLGADVVITGRVGDSALYLGALVHSYGWRWDDWDLLASGLAVGHMLECGPQVSGGYFAAPPYKVVPNIASVGLPYAEVAADGSAVITKLEETGGMVSLRTCKEQMLYEVGDPARYIHSDAVVDLTTTTLEEVGTDRVRIAGTCGAPRPDTVKAMVTTTNGFLAEGYVVFSGSDCIARAELSAQMLRDRLDTCGLEPLELRLGYIGANSSFPEWDPHAVAARDLMLHVAGRFETLAEATFFGTHSSGPLRGIYDCYGAAGSAIARRLVPQIGEVAATYSVLLPREAVPEPEVVMVDRDGQRRCSRVA